MLHVAKADVETLEEHVSFWLTADRIDFALAEEALARCVHHLKQRAQPIDVLFLRLGLDLHHDLRVHSCPRHGLAHQNRRGDPQRGEDNNPNVGDKEDGVVPRDALDQGLCVIRPTTAERELKHRPERPAGSAVVLKGPQLDIIVEVRILKADLNTLAHEGPADTNEEPQEHHRPTQRLEAANEGSEQHVQLGEGAGAHRAHHEREARQARHAQRSQATPQDAAKDEHVEGGDEHHHQLENVEPLDGFREIEKRLAHDRDLQPHLAQEDAVDDTVRDAQVVQCGPVGPPGGVIDALLHGDLAAENL
mmetsp:Transcript_100475/g.288712  ORF Transcript_100475/g.288712 Transcript_100475/m.288712 type:complete len:306 (+) Transcript_100475:270-1187(+)